MRKIVPSIIIWLVFASACASASEGPYAPYLGIENKYPLLGRKPWEQRVKHKHTEYISSVKRRCEITQIEFDTKKVVLLAKKRALEEKRKEEARIAKEKALLAEKQKEEEKKAAEVLGAETLTYALSDSKAAGRAVSSALKHVGLKYTRGNPSWKHGVDCGNLIKLAYRDAGISVPGTTDKYLNGEVGESVPIEGKDGLKNAVPGDVLVSVQTKWFRTHAGGRYTHVAMYIGDGKMVHATTPRGVHVASTSPRFAKSMIKSIRRIAK